jgi:peptidyl-prolyl cis-trans isomerase SurA
MGGKWACALPIAIPSLFVQGVTSPEEEAMCLILMRSGAGFHILKVLEKKQSDMSGTTIVQTRARHILLRLGNDLTESCGTQSFVESYKQRIPGGHRLC